MKWTPPSIATTGTCAILSIASSCLLAKQRERQYFSMEFLCTRWFHSVVGRFERRITNGQNAEQKVKNVAAIFGVFPHSSHNGVNWLNCAVSLCVFQGHTYVNLTELDLKTDSQSEAASVTNDSSMSFPKSDSLSSQMAKLSKYCT